MSREQLLGKVKDIPVSECHPDPLNPQVMNKKDMDALTASMLEGIIDPIQVVPDDSGYVILGGEHRWRVAQSLGHFTIPALVIEDERFQDPDYRRLWMVRMNKLSGRLNPDKFVALHQELVARIGDEKMREAMGFTKREAFEKLKSGIKSTLPEGLRDDFEEAAEGVDTPDDLNRVLQDILAKHGSDLSHSFCVFTFGGRPHYYVKMDSELRAVLDQAAEVCRAEKGELSAFLTAALTEWLALREV